MIYVGQGEIQVVRDGLALDSLCIDGVEIVAPDDTQEGRDEEDDLMQEVVEFADQKALTDRMGQSSNLDERGTAASMRLMSQNNIMAGMHSSIAVLEEGSIEESVLEQDVISASSEPWHASPTKMGKKSMVNQGQTMLAPGNIGKSRSSF